MSNSAVSKELKDLIVILMKDPVFADFNIGGGTNLALKYNHRESTDIDLFSKDRISSLSFKKFKEHLLVEYAQFNPVVKINNLDDELYTWMQVQTNVTKIDFIQNLPLNYEVEINEEGIRFISDRDIFSLKLSSASSRGSRKDYYDLFLLSKMYSLESAYLDLLAWFDKYPVAEYPNIFSEVKGTRNESLRNNLTSIINFNRANDHSSAGNKFKLTNNPYVKESWVDIKKIWEKEVRTLAKKHKIEIGVIQKKSNYRRKMNW
jgi:hypothetical protein